MVIFLRTWANQIITAVIIATIIEMILPSNNNKKYIKMIIGIYVLFTILQPVASVVTGKNLENIDFNYEKYFKKEELKEYEEDFEITNSKIIEDTYINSIKDDIQNKIEKKGYKTKYCEVEIDNTNKQNKYGAIKKINITLNTKEDKIKSNEDNINVNKININIKNNTYIEDSSIQEKDKKLLMEYLSKEYEIEEKNININ